MAFEYEERLIPTEGERLEDIRSLFFMRKPLSISYKTN